jgi:hypothetical protein
MEIEMKIRNVVEDKNRKKEVHSVKGEWKWENGHGVSQANIDFYG